MNFFWTPLHLAARNGYEEIVCALLEQDNINVNAEDKFAKTPLHLATMYNRKKVAYALLEQDGINVNAKDSSGNTPLNYAYDNDIIAILKEKGAVAEEYKSENMHLYSMTDKETEFDEFTSLESEIQPLSDFEQFMQSDQLI